MNIEEATDNVKFVIGDLKASNYNKTFIEAIETILTAYEKEKEKNKTLEELLQGKLFELYKYYKELANKYQGSCVSKSDLKQIVDECIPKKENIITRELEYTPNVNANSYLAQEILLLIKEE